jgi:hypothetical protein
MIQDSILVCSPDPRIPHTAQQLKDGRRKLPGYQQIGCHMIFDIKMDGQFTRKARFTANENETRDVASHHVSQ